jgi:hypothetical protein
MQEDKLSGLMQRQALGKKGRLPLFEFKWAA